MFRRLISLIHTLENQGFVIPIQTWRRRPPHQLIVAKAKKIFLVPSSRCVLTVGEEEKAGNINVISSKQNTNLRTKIMLVNPDVRGKKKMFRVPSSGCCVSEKRRGLEILMEPNYWGELLLGWRGMGGSWKCHNQCVVVWPWSRIIDPSKLFQLQIH